MIDVLEAQFPGLREEIEVTDVTTLHTWGRYMGGTQGYNNFPNRLVVGQESPCAAFLA